MLRPITACLFGFKAKVREKEGDKWDRYISDAEHQSIGWGRPGLQTTKTSSWHRCFLSMWFSSVFPFIYTHICTHSFSVMIYPFISRVSLKSRLLFQTNSSGCTEEGEDVIDFQRIAAGWKSVISWMFLPFPGCLYFLSIYIDSYNINIQHHCALLDIVNVVTENSINN